MQQRLLQASIMLALILGLVINYQAFATIALDGLTPIGRWLLSLRLQDRYRPYAPSTLLLAAAFAIPLLYRPQWPMILYALVAATDPQLLPVALLWGAVARRHPLLLAAAGAVAYWPALFAPLLLRNAGQWRVFGLGFGAGVVVNLIAGDRSLHETVSLLWIVPLIAALWWLRNDALLVPGITTIMAVLAVVDHSHVLWVMPFALLSRHWLARLVQITVTALVLFGQLLSTQLLLLVLCALWLGMLARPPRALSARR